MPAVGLAGFDNLSQMSPHSIKAVQQEQTLLRQLTQQLHSQSNFTFPVQSNSRSDWVMQPQFHQHTSPQFGKCGFHAAGRRLAQTAQDLGRVAHRKLGSVHGDEAKAFVESIGMLFFIRLGGQSH
jgi:hypothetical protein